MEKYCACGGLSLSHKFARSSHECTWAHGVDANPARGLSSYSAIASMHATLPVFNASVSWPTRRCVPAPAAPRQGRGQSCLLLLLLLRRQLTCWRLQQ